MMYCDCLSVMLSLSSSQCLFWPAMCYCGISLSYSLTFVAFGQALHQANRLENLVQLFINAESHTNGIKPVHGIDDAIAKFVFDKCVEIMWICIFP